MLRKINKNMRHFDLYKVGGNMSRIKKYIDSFRIYDWSKIANGKLAVFLIIDCILSRIFDGTNTEEYIALEFYRKNRRERAQYLTNIRSKKINNKMLKESSAEEIASIGNKAVFNKKYRDFIKRDFLETEGSDATEIKAFIEKHGTILAKPLSRSQGKGILKINNDELDDTMLNKLVNEEYLLEELIIQHHALSEINSSSVNTVRMATVLDHKGEVHIVAATLRCGSAGNFVDNFHSGGIAYPIDIENGIVVGKGKNTSDSNAYICHPSSGKLMIGFKIPNWDVVVGTVKKIAAISENMRYIGWDLAVTEDGVDLVEGNYGHAGTVLQFDHIGKYKNVKKWMAI